MRVMDADLRNIFKECPKRQAILQQYAQQHQHHGQQQQYLPKGPGKGLPKGQPQRKGDKGGKGKRKVRTMLRTRLLRERAEREFVRARRLWIGMKVTLIIKKMIMAMMIIHLKIKMKTKNLKEMRKKKNRMVTTGVVKMNQTNKNSPTIMSRWSRQF